MRRRLPWAVTYRVRDDFTGRTRAARMLVGSLRAANYLSDVLRQWPEFSEVQIVDRRAS